jgi:hypothetical protein
MAGPSALNDQAIDLLHGLLVDGKPVGEYVPYPQLAGHLRTSAMLALDCVGGKTRMTIHEIRGPRSRLR